MELLDVYDSNGKVTGRVIQRGDKSVILSNGEHIGVAIIYIENDDNKFLIQKTSKEKGGQYSSTGGHIDHGEDAYTTIIREVKEELGIDISKDDVIDLGFIVDGFILRFTFYLRKNVNLNDVVLQSEEVESVSYKSADEIRELLDNGLMHEGHYKVLRRVLDYKKMN
jgi:8-oxo-dGTP pyrophosphatase MutT (NUDIX family)